MARQLLPTMLDYSSGVLDGQALGWPTPSTDDVVEIVRRFHRDSLLALLIRLNLALTHKDSVGRQELVQKWLKWFSPELAEATLSVMRDKHITHVFHEGQLLNLMRLAILHSDANGGFRCTKPEEFVLLTRAMVLISSLMFPQPGGAAARDAAFASFTRGELFMHHEQYVPETTARNYDLFVLLPNILTRQGSSFDIAGSFRELTGMGIEDYIGLGFALLTRYDSINVAQIENADISIRKATYFGEAQVSDHLVDGLWRVVSKPIAAYRDALQAEWNESAESARWFAMRTFSQFPIVELRDGTLAAVSRRLLRDRITHGSLPAGDPQTNRRASESDP